MNRKVVITGINCITALGLSMEQCWENLKAGRSGVTAIRSFDASSLDTRIAAQVPAAFESRALELIKKRMYQQMTRTTRMCYVCARDCMDTHGIDLDAFDRTRCGVIIGAVSAGGLSDEANGEQQIGIVRNMSNALPAWISLHYKIEGPAFTVNTACASSAYAIALGFDLVASGRMDLVIAGGADSTINPREIRGFNELYALSTENDAPEKASRPFSRNRDGFVIGEGAGILVLESEESAKRRRARIYAELGGYALTSEAYNIMSPMKDGEGMARTMALALANAGCAPDDIDYINAHGTGTTLNDRDETLAIRQVFGERARLIPVSSSKSMIGHTIGAAGAIEAGITALSVGEGIVTPTINLDEPDPELDLDFVPHRARAHVIDAAISNSFAFGGHNATLVLKKYRD